MMRLLAAAAAVVCLALPAVAGMDPRSLLGAASKFPASSDSACQWSRAHIVFNNNTKTAQTAYVYVGDEVEAQNKTSVVAFATVNVAPGREEKVFVSQDQSYYVHTLVMKGSTIQYGATFGFDFQACDNPKSARAYMLTWTKNYELQPFIRRK